MIISEFYRTREDGQLLYRIFSNESFKIQSTKTGDIFEDIIEDNLDIISEYTEASEKITTDSFFEIDSASDYELTDSEMLILLKEVF